MAKITEIKKHKNISYENEILENILVKRLIENSNLELNCAQDSLYGRTIVSGGRKFIDQIISFINEARKMICLSSFLLTEVEIIDSLLLASERNISIYILTSPEKILEKDVNQEDTFRQEELELHKDTLRKIVQKTLVRTSNHLHAKFILIDPKTAHCKGILSTANFVDRELKKNLDIGLILNTEEVLQFFSLFCWGFWFESERELLEKGRLSAIGNSPYSDTEIEIHNSLLCTSKNNQSLKNNILSFIDSLQKDDEFIISTFTIQSDYEVTNKILEKIRDGVKVTIFTRMRKNNQDALFKLKKEGATILIHEKIHAKFLLKCLFEPSGIVMTSNISELGLEEGFETGLYLGEVDSRNLLSIVEQWKQNFPYEFKSEVTISEIIEGSKLVVEGKPIELDIQNSSERNLSSLTAESIELMETKEPVNFPSPLTKQKIIKNCRFTWSVYPPKLPKSAKMIKNGKKNPFPIFETKNSKYLVITDTKDLKKAEKLAKDLQAKIVLPDK